MTIDQGLKALGYKVPNCEGYCEELVLLVIQFQRKHKIPESGMPDFQTIKLIRELVRNKKTKTKQFINRKNLIHYAS